MSDKQVRDEVVTLFVAGHETTAAALAWSMYLLAQHPDALARAREEALSLGGRAPTFEDLPKLGYCLRVFKEAMRLYPPVYFFGRQAIADVRLGDSDNGYVAVTDGVRAGERVVTRGAWSVKLAASGGAVPAHGHSH